MSTNLERHRAEMKMLAYPAVEQFIAEHPDYTISADQSGSRSATNYVIFGQRGPKQVVFKYFCEDERKDREVYALHYFSQTGLVPTLWDESGSRLIVQSRIPGHGLPNPGDQRFRAIDSSLAGNSLGQATARLLSVPFAMQEAEVYERRFYDGLALENYFRNILEASWLIHQRVDAYGSALFARSLQDIEATLPFILAQKRLLYHQDALNMNFAGSTFSGFFDLEMCRIGTEPMQIGSLWAVFANYQNWTSFSQGYAKQCGRVLNEDDFRAAKAFADFLVWRYISRYGRWRAEAENVVERARAETDMTMYQGFLELNNFVSP